MRTVLLFLLLLSFKFVSAQKNVKKTPGPSIFLSNPVEINFSTDARIDNLLIVITDSTGRTVFLDNRYRFQGPYHRSVDLSRSGKGPYNLYIAKDAERGNTKFFLKPH